MNPVKKLVSALAVGLSLAATAEAQCEKTALTAFDGSIQENYGRSTSIEDPYAVVGAPSHPIGVASGAAYIYARSGTTWVLDQKIQAADNDPVDLFGISVSQSGSRVVVGAPEDDGIGTNAGAAYVFRRDPGGWVQEQKLATSIVSPLILLGTSCSLDGDRVAIGAPGYQGDKGAVWIFTRSGTTWTQQAVLVPTYPETKAFGRSVALEGNRLVVGAPSTQGVFHDAGTVQVFQFNGSAWVQQQVLETPNPAAAGFFGYTTAVSGDRLAVGAFWETSTPGVTGRAYVYREVAGVWTLEADLAPSELQNSDRFGQSVALDGINLIVGAMIGDGPATDSGTAYLFQYNGSSWVRVSRFWGSTTGSTDQFGVSVDVRGLYVITGADFYPLGDMRGAAYIFGRCP